MFPLNNEERWELLRLARRTLESRLLGGAAARAALEPLPQSPALRQKAGVFVSLHRGEELRGCVGYLEPRWPLHRAVPDIALAAASQDPRFPPLRPAELAEVDLEISVLSPPQPIRPEEIEIGVHGLVVSQGGLRGLLLPQVALERGWTPLRFLEETCRKAGLPPDSWKAGVRLEAFQADVFGEKSLAGGPPGGPHSSSTMSPTAASDRL